ncbi:MAG TPA: TolC family protein [Thermoanaerobaculia bacterium]|nr:TolC family protein [Thermoanaerobaculia bacterium]
MVMQSFFRHTARAALSTVLLVPAAGRADQIDLASAMARARANAREVAASDARRDAAEERVRIARSFRRPQIRLSETWIRTDSPAQAFALQLEQERFSFPEFAAADPNSPEAIDAATTRLELEVPLWTGGEITARIAQASHVAEGAAASGERAADAAALAAGSAWVRLAQARERVALLERARDAVAAHVELARAYTDEGMLVRSELLRAEVELAGAEDLLIEARGDARVAEAELSFRLAAPLGTTWELGAVPAPPPLEEELAPWLATVADRRDLRAARSLLAAGELEARAQRAGRLPRVGLVARGDLVDDTLFGSHGDSTTVLAVAQLELWNGGRRRAAIAAAEAEAVAGRAEVELLAEGVRLEVERALSAARVARARQATAASALQAAEESLRIVEERFRAGVVQTIDVLDAATARREAETRELVARAEANLAALGLAFTAGRAPETALSGAGKRESLP